MSCAKTAEPIKLQLGKLSRVGPGNSITWGVDAAMGRGNFGGV